MNETILHISLIANIGPSVVEKLARLVPYERFYELYSWKLQDFTHRAGLSERAADVVFNGLKDTASLQTELALISKHAIKWVTYDDPSYPNVLKSTHLPPPVLYWLGSDLKVVDRSIAMVGARKANVYGQRAIEYLVPDLVASGWTIVSGGAIGADTMAHQATIKCGGATVAVIGSGLLKPYPSSNVRLFNTMIERGGIVMSPFPLTMAGLPGNFPARNRIIAGLSQATVVVQAAEKSGALITAMFALEQGREVCAVPGHINDQLSAGCHALIRDGAVLVSSAHDIITAVCGIEAPQLEPLEPRPAQSQEVQDPIVKACAQPQLFDDLSHLLGYDESHLQDRLMTLQLEGFLEQDIMGRWCSTI